MDLRSSRKAYFSPSYCLPNSSLKFHLWLKPEITIDETETYSTVCIVLERCDNKNELPACFDCCFFLNDIKTNPFKNETVTVDTSTVASKKITTRDECFMSQNEIKMTTTNVENVNIFPRQVKSSVTTDTFHMSGQVSKPMILYKSTEFFSFMFDHFVNIEFTIRVVKEEIV